MVTVAGLSASPAFAQSNNSEVVTTADTIAVLTASSAVVSEALPQPQPTCTQTMFAANLGSLAITPAAGPAAFSKSAAILGGGPSSLDRIRAAQEGDNSLVSLPHSQQNTVEDISNRDPSYDHNSETFAVDDRCTGENSPQSSTVQQQNVSSENQLILGTLRLSIKRTPFDSKWGRVTVIIPHAACGDG